MVSARQVIALAAISLSAAASGCTRFETSRRPAPPDGQIMEDSADQVLYELEGTLLELDDVLAESEQWTIDPP